MGKRKHAKHKYVSVFDVTRWPGAQDNQKALLDNQNSRLGCPIGQPTLVLLIIVLIHIFTPDLLKKTKQKCDVRDFLFPICRWIAKTLDTALCSPFITLCR